MKKSKNIYGLNEDVGAEFLTAGQAKKIGKVKKRMIRHSEDGEDVNTLSSGMITNK